MKALKLILIQKHPHDECIMCLACRIDLSEWEKMDMIVGSNADIRPLFALKYIYLYIWAVWAAAKHFEQKKKTS